MTVYKKIVNAFIFICKTGKSVFLTKRTKVRITARKKFMSITLMTDIPDNCILRTVKNSVKRNRQFNGTKVTGKVSAIFSDYFYDSFSDFGCELLYFFMRKFFYIVWRMNFIKQNNFLLKFSIEFLVFF